MIRRLKEILPTILRSDFGNILFIVGVAIYWSLHWIRFIAMGFITSSDTSTYFAAGELFANGGIDYLRTPIYPLICHIMQHYFGEYVLESLTALHLIVFYISIIFLYRTISLFTDKWACKFIPTALYAWSIPIYEMCLYIMTESLSISGMVILIYCISRIIVGKAGRGTIWSAALILLFLVFLLPFNVCFIPILALIMYFSHRKGSLKHLKSAIISLSATSVVFFSYCLWFFNTYGIFGFSYGSTLNLFMISCGDQISELPYNELTEEIQIGHGQDIYWVWFDKENCAAEAKKNLKENTAHFVKGKIILIGKSCFKVFPHAKTWPAFHYSAIFQCVTMNIIFIALMVLIPFELWLWIRKRRRLVPIIALHLLICCLSIATTIVGSSNGEIERLSMPMFPSLCLLMGLLAEQTNFRLQESGVQQSQQFFN